MIYATVNLTIGDYESTCDKTILLYRGDKNVEIRFVMKGNKFTVLDSTYAQLIIKRPSAVSVFSEPALIQNDTVVLTITEDMVDELKEIGEYTFQIRLYDTDMNARATLPPCNSCLIIERPIATEGEAAVNLAVVNDSAVMPAADMDEEEIFTEDNEYNRTIWVDGDLITDSRLNKIENALYYINEKGGGGSATAPYISTSLDENVQVGTGEDFDLHLDFSSPNLGKGTLKVFINDVDAMSVRIDQGETITVITGDLFSKGTNKVVVYVLDRVGIMSNSLTFYVRYGGTEVTSDFDPYSAYDYGSPIRYYFTPTALDTSLTLTFHMTIDGVPQAPVSCTSDTRGYYTFPLDLSPDSHYCEAYVMDSKGTKSNVLAFNLIILSANTIVVASDAKNITVEEGEQVVLDYKVYMRDNSSFITRTFVNNALVNNGTCGLDFNYYRTSSLPEGVHTIKMEVWDVTETYSDYVTWTVTVTESTYEMAQPTNAGAIFLASAVNKSNSDERRNEFIGVDQEGNEISGTLHNFAFNSESGWVDDELIISGNSHVEIPIQPLANNARYGFTLDLEFASRQIGVEDAEVLTLWNDEKDCGIRVTTENLILRSAEGNECNLYFTDNERTNVMFVIDRNERKAKIYLNGVMCEAFHLSDYTADGVAYLEDFTVNSNLILGGYNKNGHSKIRNLRVYQVALTTDEIINNWISCEIDKTKQRELVEFQKGNDLPTMYIYCDFSGLGKDDKKPCRIVYNSTDEAKYGKSFNLDHKQSTCQYQGTSSMAYPIKNYRINLADATGEKWKYDFPGGQPEHRFTLKADFMNSCHAHNTGMAKFINDNLYNYKTNDEKSMNPFKWNHIQNGGDINDFREAINGFPCRLILVNDGETPLNEGQNEPTPGNTKDMGIFNFNNDKDATTTLGFDSDIFPNCASYEVTANSDTSAGAFISYTGGKDVIQADYYVQSSDQQQISGFIPISVFKGQPIINTNAVFKSLIFYDENLNQVGSRGTSATYNIPDGSVYFSIGWFTVDFVLSGIIFRPGNQMSGLGIATLTYPNYSEAEELDYIKQSFELRYPDADDVSEDWGFMGAGAVNFFADTFTRSGAKFTTDFRGDYFGTTVEIQDVELVNEGQLSFFYHDGTNTSFVKSSLPITVEVSDTSLKTGFASYDTNWISFTINGVKYYAGNEVAYGTVKDPYESTIFDTSLGLKALIDWVDNCTDEEFVRDFEQHFHKDYTLRYYALVVLIGAVDNLGKNMMLDTADNKIFFPRFYDIDTILSYDNSGDIKFDVDIEMEQGYWNTSSSRLWTRLRDLFHDDIVATYNNMRQNGVSYEKIMQYMYDEQISKIPQKYYNMDYDIKYAPFEDSYIGMAHGNGYEHMKRWLKNRFIFCDTLFDYAPSYNNDVLTIRANTTELMNIEIETYTPVYQHVSWYNGQMDKKKIDGKVGTGFSGTAMAATDQEVLIYGGSNVKRIKGISSMNPNQMLIGSATKLVDLDASGCPLLADINSNKANLSPHTYLNRVNLKDCPLLGGNLRLNNSPLIQEIDMRGTAITGLNLPSSVRNLQVLRLPNGISDLTLNDAGMLHTLEFDDGVAMNSVSMTNCNALTNVIGLDLLQTPSITLDNSYNSVAELYFRDTTNLTLRNLPNLERVIFTPNNEYETFETINVANAPDYKVTTFNCPKLSTFMTTAPYRESYMINAKYLGFMLPGKTRTELEYIQSDGNQYFDVGIIPKTGDVIVMDLDMDKRADANYDYFIGGNSVAVQFNNTSSSQLTIRGCTISPRETATGDIPACNVSERNTYTVTMTIGDGHTLKIFAGSYQGTFETTNKGAGKLYSFKYFSNNSLIRDYIPCKDEDGITCLYDNITNEFLYPDGTLIAGSEADVSDKVVETWDKDYGDIQPNTTFTANSIDISNTQFTDVKLLCTTDTNTLKLPTTVKNFYCDSSFDLDTDYLEDGEYDVVHGELVEPYTTDYEGEVNRYIPEVIYYPREGSGAVTTDFIKVHPGTDVSIDRVSGGYGYTIRIEEYKSADTSDGNGSTSAMDNVSTTLKSDTNYVKLMLVSGQCDYNVTLTKVKTPNIIPSSADGSLIFSMYAPNNTVAPASGTWDLHGLEFDNFYTFGMNNDIKRELTTETFNFTANSSNNKTSIYENDGAYSIVTSESILDDNKPLVIGIIRNGLYGYLRLGKTQITTFEADGKWGIVNLGSFNDNEMLGNIKVVVQTNNIRVYNEDNNIYTIGVNDLNCVYPNTSGIYHGHHMESFYISQIVTNMYTDVMTMPARYDDYNITIKNANISPKTHNTMLYPLLVNEDNPITGYLNYFNYGGDYLSWSFAYVRGLGNTLTIIQPQTNLINTYKYKYNAFYQTDYEFNNPYEIAIYTSNASGVLPGFNTEFTYTYDEIDNGDGTYTTKIYADSLDNLPTHIEFYNNKNVLTVDKLNIDNITDMRAMFMWASNITSINTTNWDTTKVTDMTQMFNGCSSLTKLDVSGFNTSNVTGMANMFNECKALTSLDVSGFDTSEVVDMSYMFSGCKALTTLDVSGFDTSNVTNMRNMFYNCSGLTSLDVSGFDTIKVTNMNYMFHGCNNLTSLDVSGFDTGKVTNMGYMFTDCRALTTLDLSSFNTSNVGNTVAMFNNCSSLTSLNVSSFNTSNVVDMTNMFRGCSSLTSLDVSGFDNIKATSMANMFTSCNNLTSLDLSGFTTSNVINMTNIFSGCISLTSLNVSSFNTSNVVDMTNMFNNCISLTSLDLSSFNTSNVTNMASMFSRCNNLTSIDLSSFNTSKVTNMSSMFRYCDSIETLSLDNFDTSKVTDMSYMFQSNPELKVLDLSAWDVDSVTNFREFITLCGKLTSLNLSNWSLDNVNTIIPQLSVSPSTSTLYGTVIIDESTLKSGWIYDNALVIAKYTANATGVLPGFNTDFTGYTTGETDNGDGTYTVSIATDSVDNLPTKISFTAQTNLLTVDKLNTSKVTSFLQMFRSCENLTRINCRLDTSGVTNEVSQVFLGCTKLEYVDVTDFIKSNIKYASSVFSGCSKLTSIDVSSWDTSQMTSLTSFFQNCSSLTTIIGLNAWDTSNVASMDQFVFGCPLLSNMNVSNWDVGKCVNFASAFRGTAMTTLDLTNWKPGSKLSGTQTVNLANLCRDSNNLRTVIAPNLVNEKVNTLNYSFQNCSALIALDMSDWDVSNVVDMSCLFQHCSALTSLDLSNWNTSNVTIMNAMLNGCSKLVDLKTDFTLNKTNMNGFLYSCSSLADLTNVKLRGTVTSINAFAYHVPSLTLDLSTLDCTYETEGMNIYTFINSNIEHFYPPTNLSKSIDIRHTTSLSIDSIVRIFTNLITTTEALTVTLSAGVLNKLTDEQIAIATNKGWTITAP